MRENNSLKIKKRRITFGRTKGQGVVEYAGALVVASVLISSFFTIFNPDSLPDLLEYIYDTTETNFRTYMPG